MPKRDLRQVFGSPNARRYQMSQKAPKEQMPGLIAELVNRQSNVHTLTLVQQFLNVVTVQGSEHVMNLARCMKWVEGVINGENTRIGELKNILPDQDTEVKLGPEEPEVPQAPAEPDEPAEAAQAPTVGQVEMQRGEPVLGAAA